jgi:transposase-like protein
MRKVKSYIWLAALAALVALAVTVQAQDAPGNVAVSVNDDTPTCPRCHSSEQVVPIIYGYPSEELFEAADRGEVKLGGCVVTGDDPQWFCKSCDYSW